MLLNEQQKRYITLDGRPVNTGRLLGLINKPSVQAGVLATAFNTAVAYQASPVAAAIAFTSTAAGVVFGELNEKWHNNSSYRGHFGSNHAALCIDKAPDGKTPPTSPKHLLGAQVVSRRSRITLGLYSLVASLMSRSAVDHMTGMVSTGSLPPVMMFVSMGAYAAAMTAEVTSSLRFNRVAKQKWNIVDMPRPLEKKQEVKSGWFAPQVT